MRQIGTLPDEPSAARFTDYLLTLGVEAAAHPEDDGTVGVWVTDEDHLARARGELDAFRQNPADPRYRDAAAEAQRLRVAAGRQEEAYRRRSDRLRQAVDGLTRPRPVTVALIAASVAATLASGFGKPDADATQWLSIASYVIEGGRVYWHHLDELTGGQVWRAVTPMFLHFDPLHLLFNMSWLYTLGQGVEARRGWWRFLLLVLATAALSNVAEYYLGRTRFEGGELLIRGAPMFGGMSGVVYGLFGYVWMAARFRPSLGLEMPAQTVALMILWFVVCLTGFIGPVANVAHGVGLLVGVAVGYVPVLWGSR